MISDLFGESKYLLTWVQDAIRSLVPTDEETTVISKADDVADFDSWASYFTWIKSVPWLPSGRTEKLDNRAVQKANEYCEEVAMGLQSRLPRPRPIATAIVPEEHTEEVLVVEDPGYALATPCQHCQYFLAPLHLKVPYDELYRACWDGDNDVIKELCMPKEVVDGQDVLQITVKTTTPAADTTGVSCPLNMFVLLKLLAQCWIGHSPLDVAVYRRHWETAKLIVAIACAQHRPVESDKPFDINDPVAGTSAVFILL